MHKAMRAVRGHRLLLLGAAALVAAGCLFLSSDEVVAEVAAARAGLAPDDKGYDSVHGWLEDLSHIAGGKVIGRTGDPGGLQG